VTQYFWGFWSQILSQNGNSEENFDLVTAVNGWTEPMVSVSHYDGPAGKSTVHGELGHIGAAATAST